MKSAAAARTAVCAGRIGNEKWSDGRVARQRSAKPCTAVRIRFRPHQNSVVDYYNGVLFLACHTSSDIRIIRVLIEAVAEMHSCINNYHPGVGKSCTRIGLSCRLSSERDAM